jgi:dienelactone hydrolase
VLVLHGANDPFVPPGEVTAFEEAMTPTDVDWQVIIYGGAVHSFTDPLANQPGKSMYDARTAARAFEAMKDLFKEVF